MAPRTKKSATKKTAPKGKRATKKRAARKKKATPKKPVEAQAPEAPIEAKEVHIPTDTPKRKPRPQLPLILGTRAVPDPPLKASHEFPSPDVAVNNLQERYVARAKKIIGPMIDLWVRAGQCGVHVAVSKNRVLFALAASFGHRFDGVDGLFAALRGMGGHPFGLAVLIRPLGREPFVMLRWPYRHEGHVVAGEMWVASQGEDKEWTATRWGNAKRNAVRWFNAIDAAEE